MSGFCGWSGFTADRDKTRRILDAMTAALSSSGKLNVAESKGTWALAVVDNYGDTEIVSENEITAITVGRPTWKDATLSELAKAQGTAAALVTGYQEHGPEVVRKLSGSFSVALVVHATGDALLAVDRTAAHPIVYTPINGGLVFAATADAVIRHPTVEPSIDHQAIFNYLYFHVVPGPGMIYQRTQRLLPGTYLFFSNGALQSRTYNTTVYQDDSQVGFDANKAEFHNLLRSCIRRSAEDAKTGTFLSGGTDSSTVTGILTEVSGASIPTFSIGFDAEGYDEMEYARIVARHFGTDHHEYYVTPNDVVEAIPRVARSYDNPFGNASAVPTFYCARLAKDNGVERLLGGDGGDEIFAGNARYAKQWLFSLYGYVPGPVRDLLVEPMLEHAPLRSRLTPLRKLHSFVQQARVPMPHRMETYNLLSRLGVDAMFTSDFLDTVDVNEPISLLEHYYQRANTKNMINRILDLDMKFTLADNDLPKVKTMCDLAGMEVLFPLLTDDLIDFAARLPVKLKLKRTQLRYFFKEALKDFLPPEVLTKSKHGFGLPFGVWQRTHAPLRELAYDSLNALKNRHLINSAFIDELQSTKVNAHPAYFGTLVWVLMMLEQWFDQHMTPLAVPRKIEPVTTAET